MALRSITTRRKKSLVRVERRLNRSTGKYEAVFIESGSIKSTEPCSNQHDIELSQPFKPVNIEDLLLIIGEFED